MSLFSDEVVIPLPRLALATLENRAHLRKKEYSDDDYDYSSSSSSSAIEDDPYTLFNDFGQSLDALTDMQDIDKLGRNLNQLISFYFEEESDRVATKKDEVRAKLGQPT